MSESTAQAQGKYETHEIKNRDKNKLLHSDRQFHDWYRFVLSFPPQLVRDYFRRFEVKENEMVLDPFCGTGTTLVEARFANFRGVGFEANRFAQLACEVKLDWSVDPTELLDAAELIRHSSLLELSKLGISDVNQNENVDLLKLKSLSAEKRKLILKDSISPVPLHKTLVLREQIDRYANTGLHKHLLLGLANIVVFKASNLRFGPEVGVGKLKSDSPVVEPWFEQVSQMSRDLLSVEAINFRRLI